MMQASILKTTSWIVCGTLFLVGCPIAWGLQASPASASGFQTAEAPTPNLLKIQPQQFGQRLDLSSPTPGFAVWPRSDEAESTHAFNVQSLDANDYVLRHIELAQDETNKSADAIANSKLAAAARVDDGQPLTAASPFGQIIDPILQWLGQWEAQNLTQPNPDAELVKRGKETRELLTAAQNEWNEAVQLDARIKQTPQLVREIKETLATPPQEANPLITSNASANEAQAVLDAAKQSLQQRKQEYEQKQAALAQRPKRKTEIEAAVVNIRKQLETTPVTPPLAADASPLDAINQLSAKARRLLYRTQLLRAELSLQHLDSSAELDKLSRDLTQRLLSEEQTSVDSLESLVTQMRRVEVQQQAEKAKREAEDAHPAIRSMAENNALLVKGREELQRKIDSATEELKQLKSLLESVKRDRENLENKVAVAGMNRTVGLLMRQFQQRLPDISGMAGRIRAIGKELPGLQLTRMELDEQRQRVADVHGVVKEKLAQVVADNQIKITPSMESAVTELVSTLRQLTDDLSADLDQYINKLSEIEITAWALIKDTREFRFFVDKHVLWIRSTEPLSGTDIRNAFIGLVQIVEKLDSLVSNAEWGRSLASSPVLITTILLVILFGWYTDRRIRQKLAKYAASAARSSTHRLAVMTKMLALSTVLAAFWPTVLWAIAQTVNNSFDGGPLTSALVHTLYTILPFVATACALRQLTMRHGFADVYFAWPEATVRVLHRSINWYLLIVVPIRGFGVFFDSFEDGQWAASAGRVMFIISQLILFVCLSFAVRQVGRALVAARPKSIWVKTRQIWYAFFMIFPLILAGLSMIGYHYSATELAFRFSWTVWIILAACSLVSLVRQIVQVVLHKISLRRFWLSHTREDGEEDENEFDAAKVNHEIGRLLNGFTVAGVAVATFLLWSQVLPAIQFLDRVELWSHSVEVAQTVKGVDGETTHLVAKTEIISLADLAWAIVVLILTLVLSRNVPGLLEVALLDRLPLDRGGRYAVCLIGRYLVALVGIIWVCRILGVEWSSVQWLVAAMSVGLGFGLQEIFGNLVSGMIILLERPVRMGDLVTVNGTTGHVTRIQLRATTITDFDRREMIVPNKKFIIDDVMNWTLTDQITRMVIRVGIAYGSDTELACQTLLDVAKQSSYVLNDPAPSVVFVGFGASSLDLELRFFIPDREHLPEIQHFVHMEIDRAFRERQIEIAFPQQDLHIRSVAPLAEVIESIRKATKSQRNSNAA